MEWGGIIIYHFPPNIPHQVKLQINWNYSKLHSFYQVEGQATEILESKLGLKLELEKIEKQVKSEVPAPVIQNNSEELAKVSLFLFSADRPFYRVSKKTPLMDKLITSLWVRP